MNRWVDIMIPDCKFCGSEDTVKDGFVYQGGKTQRYLCKECGRTYTKRTLNRAKKTESAEGEQASEAKTY